MSSLPLKPVGPVRCTDAAGVGCAAVVVEVVEPAVVLVAGCGTAVLVGAGAAASFTSAVTGKFAIGSLTTTKVAATQPDPPAISGTASCTQELVALRPCTTKTSRGKAFPTTEKDVPGPDRILSREPVMATWAVGWPSATGVGRSAWAGVVGDVAVAVTEVVVVVEPVAETVVVAVTVTGCVVSAAAASPAPVLSVTAPAASSCTGRLFTLKTTTSFTSTQPLAASVVRTKSELPSAVRPTAVKAVPVDKMRTDSPPGVVRKVAPALPTTAINSD